MEKTVRTTPAPSRSLPAAAGFAAAVLATALVGGVAAAGSGGVYARLDLPAWAPPAWLFSPVWIALYVCVAVAGWLVWRAAEEGVAAFLAVYALQLLLNAAWTPLFFGAALYGAALVDIVLLAAAVAVTLLLALRHSRAAALLLAPYLAWVVFAAALNAAIWAAN
ncbi:TspO/MBR family protein [Nocardiopsis ganjiahuensis]|uniref:TspO/MBR family protein n=1 Tax=Nocardiopsis ganjiahuensis TaxID=239984 RepID=UPI00034612B9|nr:TspO/MBR family protein [Nocardiopsis ganjiahuensis]